jgi:hypothetical protein
MTTITFFGLGSLIPDDNYNILGLSSLIPDAGISQPHDSQYVNLIFYCELDYNTMQRLKRFF